MTPTQTAPPAESSPAGERNPVLRKVVPIGRITVDPGIQVRGHTDPARIEEYRQIIRDQGFMDPIDLWVQFPGPEITNTTAFPVLDGFARLEAYKQEGHEKVRCNIRPLSRSDAIRFATQRNGHHGRPMTNAEKRHACEVSVLDPEIGNETDKEIALRIGCSAQLVSEVRRGITKDAKAKKRKSVSVESHTRSAPGGKRESESPAPREATARERQSEPNRPTKARIMREIEDYLKADVIEEADIIKSMDSPNEEYRWTKKPGGVLTLKVVGKSGRVQVEVPVIVKQVDPENIVLKFEGGKLTVEVKDDTASQ